LETFFKEIKKQSYDPIHRKVSVVSDVSMIQLQPKKEYILLLASDGLWDEMNNAQLGRFIASSQPQSKGQN